MRARFRKIGAACYLLWAALHVLLGISLVHSALFHLDRHLAELGTGLAVQQLPKLGDAGLVSAIAAFHSFNMVWLGALVGFIAFRLNWHGSRLGFWLNLVIAGFLDVGLFAFMLVPGYMAWSDALVGPTLFVLGAVFTSLDRSTKNWQSPRFAGATS